MPADFFIDTQLKVVFSKATGLFGRAEALDHMTRLRSHPDFRPEFNQLADFRQVAAVTLTSEDIRQLASENIFSPHSNRAFVASGDLVFALGRMFGTYRDLEGEPGIRIFREMEAALSFLSLSAEPDPGLFTRLESTDHDNAQPET